MQKCNKTKIVLDFLNKFDYQIRMSVSFSNTLLYRNLCKYKQ